MGPAPGKSRLYICVPVFVSGQLTSTGAALPDGYQVGFVLYLDTSINIFGGTGDAATAGSNMLQFIGAAFEPFKNNLGSMMVSRRAFFNDIATWPKETWKEAEAITQEFIDLLVLDAFKLEMPPGVTAEVTLNRFQEVSYNEG